MAARPQSLTRIAALIAARLALAVVLVRSHVGELPRLPAARGGTCLGFRRRPLRRAVAQAGSGCRKAARAAAARQTQARAPAAVSAVRRQLELCGAINAKIEKMERNLDALQRKRSRPQTPARAGRARRSWRRSRRMAAATRRSRSGGCRVATTATRSLLDHLFGGGIRQRSRLTSSATGFRRDEDRHVRRVPESPDGGWVNDDGQIRYSAPPGSYRTLCVRTCDGYFFPMSSASSRGGLRPRPAELRISLPGTEVQVYYHQAEGEESADMISACRASPIRSCRQPISTSSPARRGRKAAAAATEERRSEEFQHRGRQSAGRRAGAIRAGHARTRARGPTRPPTRRRSPTLDGGLDAEAIRRMAVTPKRQQVDRRPARRRGSGSSGQCSFPTQKRQ